MKQSAQPVLIEYHDGGARKVRIAGSFNDWRPDGPDMINMDGGKWAKEILLPPGTYEYRLVVDGKWKTDPAAQQTVPTPFGETNGLLVVGQSPAAPHGPTHSLWSPKSENTNLPLPSQTGAGGRTAAQRH